MNWNHFLLLLIGIYVGYYAVNIIADLYLKRNQTSQENDADILLFSEDSQPEIIVYEDEQVPQQPTIEPAKTEEQNAFPAPAFESTGGVSLKELIRTAQAGMLQYTKAIPY